jgi:hypothetical protein
MQTTYQHLQLEERAFIQTMLEQGYKPSTIKDEMYSSTDFDNKNV